MEPTCEICGADLSFDGDGFYCEQAAAHPSVPSVQAAQRARTFYPYPNDCEACQEGMEADRMPCEDHAHLAEPDPERGHKEA